MFKLVLEKAEEPEIKLPTSAVTAAAAAKSLQSYPTLCDTIDIRWIIEKAREFQKNIYFCFTDYAFDCVDHNKLWEILQEMGIPDHLTCLLRNLYAGQEATVGTGHRKTDWF